MPLEPKVHVDTGLDCLKIALPQFNCGDRELGSRVDVRQHVTAP